MSSPTLALALLITGLVLGGLSGCEKKEGAAEKAGKALDGVASDIRETAEETEKEIEDKLND